MAVVWSWCSYGGRQWCGVVVDVGLWYGVAVVWLWCGVAVKVVWQWYGCGCGVVWQWCGLPVHISVGGIAGPQLTEGHKLQVNFILQLPRLLPQICQHSHQVC